jgi:WD40 repeat protein
MLALLLLFPFHAAAQKVPEPEVKTPFPVKSLSWNSDDTLFSLGEENVVFVRDAQTSRVVHTVNFHDALSLMFASEGGAGRSSMLGLSADGTMNVWNLGDTVQTERGAVTEVEPSYIVAFEDSKRIISAAFSNSSDSIAAGMDDGSVYIYFKLRYTHQLVSHRLEGHRKPAYSLQFSPDNTLLVSASEDGTLIIWDAVTGAKNARMNFYGRSGTPVLFTADSSSVISCTARNSISVRAIDGTVKQEIRVRDGILTFTLASGGRDLIVQTQRDNLEFYHLDTGAYFGYIPPYNASPLTSFSFSSDGTQLLAGHRDGSVYRLTTAKVFLKPGQRPPRVRLVAASELVVKGSGHSDTGLDREGTPVKETGASVLMSKDSAVDLTAGVRLLPSPYAFALTADCAWRTAQFTGPFYFGAGVQGLFGFPSSDFPYSYTLDGQSAKPPFMTGVCVYAPAGAEVQFRKGMFRLFTEIQTGFRLTRLGNAELPENVSTRLYPSFTCSLVTGGGFRYGGAAAGAEYDTVLGFMPRFSLYGRIIISKSSKMK